MSNPECKNVCITFAREASHDSMKKVIDEITTAGGTINIGVVSVVHNMYSV